MKIIELGPLLVGSIAYHRRFRRQGERQPVDGSRVAMTIVDELATLPGPLIDKLFVLYACGVHDYQKEVFDPRQVLAMMRFNDQYQPGRIIRRANGNTDGSFCYAGPNDKENLLKGLCERVEIFDPTVQKPSELQQAREELIFKGTSEKILSIVSNRALAVYFLANETQFLLKLIHPFWERHGRTSEEFLHLICAMNGVDKLVFSEDVNQRYNPVTKERMKLINDSTMNLLAPIAERMGLEVQGREFQHIDDLYRAWFEHKGRIKEFERLNWKRKNTPLKYLQSRAVFIGESELMGEYFAALSSLVEKRIEHLGNNQFPLLLQDNIVQTLVAHQLSQGHRLEF